MGGFYQGVGGLVKTLRRIGRFFGVGKIVEIFFQTARSEAQGIKGTSLPRDTPAIWGIPLYETGGGFAIYHITYRIVSPQCSAAMQHHSAAMPRSLLPLHTPCGAPGCPRLGAAPDNGPRRVRVNLGQRRRAPGATPNHARRAGPGRAERLTCQPCVTLWGHFSVKALVTQNPQKEQRLVW